jgi:hypothetical protein
LLELLLFIERRGRAPADYDVCYNMVSTRVLERVWGGSAIGDWNESKKK